MSAYKDYGYTDTGATHAHQYILEPLIAMLGQQKDRIILDLGCGNGAIVHTLLSQGFDIYGMDASESGIKLAGQRNPGRFAVQDLSVQELPAQFENIPFNTVISTEVIEHLYDPASFIRLCEKVLLKNKGGEIIISTPYHGYFKNLLIAICGKWDQHANPLWNGGHIKLWSRKTLSILLNQNNFEITDFKGCGRIPYLWKSMLIKGKLKHGERSFKGNEQSI